MLSSAVVVSLVLVLGACGDDGDGSASSDRLRVCSDTPYEPFEFKDASGKDVGYDIDILREIANDNDLELVVVDVDFAGIIGNLAAGNCTVVASALTINEERAEQADFSDPYFDSDQSLLVKAANAAAYPDLASLAGKRIGVQETTTGAAYAEANKPEGAEIVSYQDADQLFAALESDQIAAILQDFPVNYDRASKDDAFVLTATFPTEEHYGFAVKKGDTETLQLLNRGLQEIEDDGRLDDIYDRYFPEVSP